MLVAPPRSIVPLNATNVEKSSELLGAASSQLNGKPTRSPRACSIAAKRLLHRAVAPTISPGRVRIPAARVTWNRLPTPSGRGAQLVRAS